jgi:hypothetical protein
MHLCITRYDEDSAEGGLQFLHGQEFQSNFFSFRMRNIKKGSSLITIATPVWNI